MKRLLSVLLMLASTVVMAEPVNINQADATTLANSLKGIGPKKAEAIVQYRKEHGDFKTLKDLEAVKGIGPKTIQSNEKDILLTPASGEPASATTGNEAKPEVKADTKEESGKKAK